METFRQTTNAHVSQAQEALYSKSNVSSTTIESLLAAQKAHYNEHSIQVVYKMQTKRLVLKCKMIRSQFLHSYPKCLSLKHSTAVERQ